MSTEDVIENPKHYTSHPSGIECIQITEHMGFNLGNAMKYIWRCDLKKDAIEDLKKAKWYLEREIAKRENVVRPSDVDVMCSSCKHANSPAWEYPCRGCLDSGTPYNPRPDWEPKV